MNGAKSSVDVILQSIRDRLSEQLGMAFIAATFASSAYPVGLRRLCSMSMLPVAIFVPFVTGSTEMMRRDAS